MGFYYTEINMVNTANKNYTQLDDSQLVKLAKSGKFDALSELWVRHKDFIKKVTLNQYYKIRPDFSEDCSCSEKLWQCRMGRSYMNLAKAVETYNFCCDTPFLAFFAMKNKYAFLDEKAFNTEISAKYDYCDNYDRYEYRNQDDADMAEIVHSLEKCLCENDRLLAFFQKYVATFEERGYLTQTKMASIMGMSRQVINTNFKKIRAIAQEYGLKKEFVEILVAQERAQNYIQDSYLNDYDLDEAA